VVWDLRVAAIDIHPIETCVLTYRRYRWEYRNSRI
jgi:hypothetical protein